MLENVLEEDRKQKLSKQQLNKSRFFVIRVKFPMNSLFVKKIIANCLICEKRHGHYNIMPIGLFIAKEYLFYLELLYSKQIFLYVLINLIIVNSYFIRLP